MRLRYPLFAANGLINSDGAFRSAEGREIASAHRLTDMRSQTRCDFITHLADANITYFPDAVSAGGQKLPFMPMIVENTGQDHFVHLEMAMLKTDAALTLSASRSAACERMPRTAKQPANRWLIRFVYRLVVHTLGQLHPAA